ncbi:hypothetical protein Hanom_Chr13g01186051 [Helianthus anomalus]
MNKELKPNRCLFYNLHYKTHPFSPFPTKPITFLTDSPPNRFIHINFTKFSSKSSVWELRRKTGNWQVL